MSTLSPHTPLSLKNKKRDFHPLELKLSCLFLRVFYITAAVFLLFSHSLPCSKEGGKIKGIGFCQCNYCPVDNIVELCVFISQSCIFALTFVNFSQKPLTFVPEHLFSAVFRDFYLRFNLYNLQNYKICVLMPCYTILLIVIDHGWQFAHRHQDFCMASRTDESFYQTPSILQPFQVLMVHLLQECNKISHLCSRLHAIFLLPSLQAQCNSLYHRKNGCSRYCR